MSEFSKNRAEQDGLARTCRKCTNEMNKASRLKRKERRKMLENKISNIKEENPLSSYTPRELIDELGRRGYRGKLEYTYVLEVKNPA